jgi:hypothetical protein
VLLHPLFSLLWRLQTFKAFHSAAFLHPPLLRVAPFVTEISAAVVTIDWAARRAHLSLISPRASFDSAADIHTVPDVFAAIPLGDRSSSQFHQSLRRRCAPDGARGLRLYVPEVCGANALASLVLCCCAAVAVVVTVGIVAVRALSLKNAESKWGRRPFKDRREDL